MRGESSSGAAGVSDNAAFVAGSSTAERRGKWQRESCGSETHTLALALSATLTETGGGPVIQRISSASVTGESMSGSHIAYSSTLAKFRRSARYDLQPHQKLEVKGSPAATPVNRFCLYCTSLTHPAAPDEGQVTQDSSIRAFQ